MDSLHIVPKNRCPNCGDETVLIVLHRSIYKTIYDWACVTCKERAQHSKRMKNLRPRITLEARR